jgi:hypothetical protein
MTFAKLLDMTKFTASEVVAAYLVSIIAPGGPLLLPKLVLAVKLNVFALPLAPTPVLRIPLWCWYVVAVLWMRQWLYYSEYSVADVLAELEEGYASIRQ